MSTGMLRLSQILIDLVVLAVALCAAYLVRFDGVVPAAMAERLLITGPNVVALEYFVLLALGIRRFSWRYIGLREVTRILTACGVATGVLIAARLFVGQLQDSSPNLRFGLIPLGVLAVNFVLTFVGVIGVRVSRRMMGERREKQLRSLGHPLLPTLLVGAGQAGVFVAREIASRPDLGMRAVGFVDDDRTKIGTVIQGIPVLADTSQLAELCKRFGAAQVLITMANVPGSTVRRVRALCDQVGVSVKIIPGVYEIVGGSVNLSRIRDVAIEDLLGRQPVTLDLDGIAACIRGRVVMTTGAGGSIGSELCRQIARFEPAGIVLVERSENALFNIHRELLASCPGVKIVPCMADITDTKRMSALLEEHAPAIVLHAAAHKHVPMMEWNPGEAIKNNVLGTRALADLAASHDVETFVMISTDKAVNPTSVMGATKRAAELYVQSLSGRSNTKFVIVRFGNVLGSAGSVIPIFREQIERGGPVTVTHPDMRRYFMTIPEACQLVLQAGAMGDGGEIFILDMGEPVKVVDLARDLIALSGLKEGEDVEIVFTGVRPGEKLTEELTGDSEIPDNTRHPKIFVGRVPRPAFDDTSRRIAELAQLSGSSEGAELIRALRKMVPEYRDIPIPETRAAMPSEAPTSQEKAREESLLTDSLAQVTGT